MVAKSIQDSYVLLLYMFITEMILDNTSCICYIYVAQNINAKHPF